MPDPDKSSSASYTYSTSVILAVFVACMVILFCNDAIKLTQTTRNVLLYIFIPVMSFLLSGGIALLGQYFACGSIHAVSAFTGSILTPITVGAALILSAFSIFRAPIISLFSIASMDCRKPASIGSSCLSDIESKYSIYKGIAIAYYVFWGVMFGQTISSGFSQVCTKE